ncbi:MAG: hypothetical protein U1E65_03945 [Myxococcota bacterium]
MIRRSLLLLLLCPGPALAQSQEILKVERWVLSFHYTAQGTYSTPTSEVSETISADGTAILERTTSTEFQGPPMTSVHYVYNGRLDLAPNCTMRINIDDQGQVTPATKAYLKMFPDHFQIGLGTSDVEVERTMTSCAPPEPQISQVNRGWATVITDSFSYPSTGTTLSGTVHKRGLIQPDVTSSDGMAMTDIDVSFQITPLSAESLEVLIDDTETSFVNWRPTLGANQRPGSPLPLRAKLVGPRGATPPQRIVRTTWKLEETSHEPGVAMNMPIGASDSDPDLRLSPGLGRPGTLSMNDQVLERNIAPSLEDRIEVVPQDWGGWSTVHLEVVLDNGDKLTATAKSDKSAGLRIPKRPASSKIADAWKAAARASGLADDSDSDATPTGDGSAGDGLSLYQEYRGFYVRGAHVDGTPDTKELFVAALPEAMDGLALFELGTNIIVHAIQPGEMTAARVVNGNKDQGPGSTVQHGLKMQKDGFENPVLGLAGETVSTGTGGLRSPGAIDHIAIGSTTLAREAQYSARTIAHELSHAVGVVHHGPDGSDQRVRWDLQADGSIEEIGATMVVIDLETEAHTVSMLTGPSELAVVGVPGGQSSGDEDCWMRYIWATAYPSNMDPTIRYTRYSEAPGSALCSSKAGTGVNAPGHLPQSRYGDATRGNCSAQLRVRDP